MKAFSAGVFFPLQGGEFQGWEMESKIYPFFMMIY